MKTLTLYCGGEDCQREKFQGFFSPAEKLQKHDNQRRCISCSAKESASYRKADWKRRVSAWRTHAKISLPGSH